MAINALIIVAAPIPGTPGVERSRGFSPACLAFSFGAARFPADRETRERFNLDGLRESVFRGGNGLLNRAAGYTLVHRDDLLQISISGMRESPALSRICMRGAAPPGDRCNPVSDKSAFLCQLLAFRGVLPPRISGEP